MKKSTLIPNIFVNNITNHNQHKEVFLKYFKQQKTPEYVVGFDRISNTDWKNSYDKTREWVHYFKDNVFNQVAQSLADDLMASEIEIDNVWYQQYEKNDTHGWHSHIRTQFTNVYYVELPDTSVKTEIAGVEDIEIREGDILSFPAYLFHRSNINQSNQRKTVISFNTSYAGFNIDIYNKR
tara:strand:+ start:65 stop:607 length:543 start_codon:yes stop_codon:yes gene_type:complete